ncbi:MAG: hypothetical protein AB1568_04175 [Thermodesulfobacteriota bacterium]
MRCSKCGYISFDHLRQCRKCSTDLSELSLLLAGTALHLDPVNFLAAMYEEDEAPQYEIEVSIEEGEPAVVFGDEEEAAISVAETGPTLDEEEAPAIALAESELPTIALDEEETQPELTLAEDQVLPQAAAELADLQLEPEPALSLGPEEPQPALAALTLEEEEEIPPAALSLEAEEVAGAELPELSLLEEEDEVALSPAPADAGEEELPVLSLEDEPLPVGAPAPLRQTDDITLGLEEINLSDLVSGEEAGALSLEDEDAVDDSSLEEELFDLSDILSDADDTTGK